MLKKVLFIFTVLPWALAHASPPCAKLLTAVERVQFIEREYEGFEERVPALHRAVLKVVRNSVQRKIFLACEAKNYCTPRQVSRAVRNGVEEAIAKTNLVRGSIIVLGTMVGGAAASSYIHDVLPDSTFVKYIGAVVGPLSTLLLYHLTAPLMSRLGSFTTHWVSGIFAQKAEFASKEANLEKEDQWVQTQGELSPNAQMSRNLVGGYRAVVRANFLSALDAMERGNRRRAVNQIADAAIMMRLHFSDVEPDNKTLRLIAINNFTDEVAEAYELIPAVLKRIHYLDSEADKNPAAAQYYSDTVRYWLTSF